MALLGGALLLLEVLPCGQHFLVGLGRLLVLVDDLLAALLPAGDGLRVRWELVVVVVHPLSVDLDVFQRLVELTLGGLVGVIDLLPAGFDLVPLDLQVLALQAGEVEVALEFELAGDVRILPGDHAGGLAKLILGLGVGLAGLGVDLLR